jgi:hypothetical protein
MMRSSTYTSSKVLYATETEYQSALKRTLENYRFRVKEFNDTISPGIPDTFISGPHHAGQWCEIKHLKKQIPEGDRPFPTGKYFTRKQQSWLEDVGGFLIVGAPDGHFFFPTRALKMLRIEPWSYCKKWAVIWAFDLNEFARELQFIIK